MASMTSLPDARWVAQIAGDATMAGWGFLQLPADAEQWVCSLRDEVLSRLMLFGEQSLWYTLQLPSGGPPPECGPWAPQNCGTPLGGERYAIHVDSHRED